MAIKINCTCDDCCVRCTFWIEICLLNKNSNELVKHGCTYTTPEMSTTQLEFLYDSFEIIYTTIVSNYLYNMQQTTKHSWVICFITNNYGFFWMQHIKWNSFKRELVQIYCTQYLLEFIRNHFRIGTNSEPITFQELILNLYRSWILTKVRA